MDAFFRWATFVADVICVVVFTAEMVSKIQDRSLITGDKVKEGNLFVVAAAALLVVHVGVAIAVAPNVLMFPSQLLVLPFPHPSGLSPRPLVPVRRHHALLHPSLGPAADDRAGRGSQRVLATIHTEGAEVHKFDTIQK